MNPRKRLNILYVSGSDSKGGAAKVARSLFDGMRTKGHQTTMLCSDITKPDKNIYPYQSLGQQTIQSNVSNRFLHHLGLNQLSLNGQFPKRQSHVHFHEFDLIHLHDVPSFNLSELPWLTRQAPVIWTMHTMQAVTGNCLYSYDCELWKSRCNNCPQFGKFPLLWLHRDSSHWVHYLKETFYSRIENHRLRLIGVSEWISGVIQQSILGNFPIHTITNAIDTEHFHKQPPLESRIRLGIPVDRPTIGFSVSGNPDDRRKGLDIILEAITKLNTRDVYFLPMSIIEQTEQISDLIKQAGFQTHAPRHLSTDQQLCDYYNSADLIWHPSRADTSSLVSMEAMSCGTPVIAADVGGVPEVIGDSEVGRIIPSESPEALAATTDELLNDRQLLQRMSLAAINWSHIHFPIARMIDEHETQYYEFITKSGEISRSIDQSTRLSTFHGDSAQ